MAAEEPLVGTWRVVSYPTSEGDLLRRQGRAPGPLPDVEASLDGWSYLVFAKDGRCDLFMPQKVKDQPPHRRVTWFHGEGTFATWKLDDSKQPWRLDLGSVLTPMFQTVNGVDPKTGKPISKRSPFKRRTAWMRATEHRRFDLRSHGSQGVPPPDVHRLRQHYRGGPTQAILFDKDCPWVTCRYGSVVAGLPEMFQESDFACFAPGTCRQVDEEAAIRSPPCRACVATACRSDGKPESGERDETRPSRR